MVEIGLDSETMKPLTTNNTTNNNANNTGDH